MLHAISPGGGVDHLLYGFTLGADQASIDTNVDGPMAGLFSGLYNVLEVIAVVRTDNAAAQDAVTVFLNNDSGSNYDLQVCNAGNTTVSAGVAVATAGWLNTTVHGSGGTSNYATSVWMVFPAYANTTFNKTAVMVMSDPDGTAANNTMQTYSLGWRNTAAITRLKIAGQSTAKLKAGSSLYIYGR